jgi:hypothetical protein
MAHAIKYMCIYTSFVYKKNQMSTDRESGRKEISVRHRLFIFKIFLQEKQWRPIYHINKIFNTYRHCTGTGVRVLDDDDVHIVLL